jgi:BlaI family penicillinase repressor
MSERNISLTPTEWNLMECLWESAPRTVREAVEDLRERVGWTRSTTLTLLRRMTEKGVVRCSESGGVRTYSPLLRREDAVLRETGEILKRVYKGSVSMMMSAITKKQALTREEIDELYEILRQAEERKK